MRPAVLAIILLAGPLNAEVDGPYTFTVTNNQATITAFDRSYSGALVITNTLGDFPVTSIAESGFYDCTGVTDVTVPDTVTNIGREAFALSTHITNVVIGRGVTTIGVGAFFNCTSLSRLTLPDGLITIGDHAFVLCTELKHVYFAGDAPTPNPLAFALANKAILYYLPNTTGWGVPSPTNTYGSRPAVLWNPTPVSAGFSGRVVSFTITGTTNIPITLLACTSLTSAAWVSLQTTNIPITGSLEFRDSDSTNHPSRFYGITWP